jgi:hypothetical protein
MAVCLNKSSVEYQASLKMSGLSDSEFDAFASDFVEKNNRFPFLDEIPEANSEPVLRDTIKIDKSNFIDNKRVIDVMQANDIDDANIKINNIHRDLRVKIYSIGESSIVDIKHRPTEFETIAERPLVESKYSTGKNNGVWLKIVNELSDYYGIKIHLINNGIMGLPEWKDKILDAKTTNAFIYNGEIYLNTDNARIDAPIHEMLHILVGSMKFSDPDLYNAVTQMAESLPNYSTKALAFRDRTRSDVNEELFITEFSKFITGQNSLISKLDTPVVQRMFYNIYRVLDSSIFGTQSARTINRSDIFKCSVIDLCKLLGSDLLNGHYSGTLDMRGAEMHRIMANKKSELMKKGDLQEVCE